MAHYELTFLTRSEEDQGGMADLIGKLGGKVTSQVAWGRRRLVYPIKKENAAAYFTYQIDLPSDKIPEFNQKLKRNEQVLRHLVIAGGLRKPLETAPRKPKATDEVIPTLPTIVAEPELSLKTETPVKTTGVVEPETVAEIVPKKEVVDKGDTDEDADEQRQKKLDEKLKQILDEK